MRLLELELKKVLVHSNEIWDTPSRLNALSRLWDFPESAETVWLTLHNRPGKFRWPMRLELDSLGDFTYPVLRGPEGFVLEDGTLDGRLKCLVGEHVYVELEYE